MTTTFPTNPDTYTTKVDGVDTVMAAHINNLQDAMMAVEDFALDLRDGWCYDTDTWTYVSATSFKIAGKDVRYKFPKGTKIKLVQSGSTNYFYVTAATFSTDTTVTVTGGSDYTLANEAISGQAYSYAAAPQNFPLGTSTFVPLLSPATSTSWDGDAKSTTARTKIDLSSVFGLPDNIKAVAIRLACNDSNSAASKYLYFAVSASSGAPAPILARPSGLPNDYYTEAFGICPCDSNGDIYYQIEASGTDTMDCWMEIYGYWI